MKRFVTGSIEQFKCLCDTLEDGKCHVFKDCILPPGTTPSVTRFGFEKTESGYKIMVDYGIVTESDDARLKAFFETGEAEFATASDMCEFFHGFSCLFEDPDGSVVDIEKIEELRKKQLQRRHVRPEELSDKLKSIIYGQDEAIDKIAHEISAHMIGPADRPLVISLLGPCGVGKSATARALAGILTELYGVEYGFINESGNTLIAEHSVQKFLGAPPSYVGHGEPTVLDPVRKNPYHVILIDEIEKSHPQLLVALMEAIDVGYLSMNDNSPPIDLRSCVIIFTSNLLVETDKYRQLDNFEKTAFCRDLFKEFTHKPEISRRISEFIVFSELDDKAKVNIILGYFRDELKKYGAILAKADEELLVSFLELSARYGASELRSNVTKAIAYRLTELNDPEAIKGKRIRLSGNVRNVVIEIEEEEE